MSRKIRKALRELTDEELLKLSPRQASIPLSRSPHPRQAEFLALDCEEALYGGAAGGGKTEALLMWLAQGVKVPSYSANFFRRTYAQLSKSNELESEWLTWTGMDDETSDQVDAAAYAARHAAGTSSCGWGRVIPPLSILAGRPGRGGGTELGRERCQGLRDPSKVGPTAD